MEDFSASDSVEFGFSDPIAVGNIMLWLSKLEGGMVSAGA